MYGTNELEATSHGGCRRFRVVDIDELSMRERNRATSHWAHGRVTAPETPHAYAVRRAMEIKLGLLMGMRDPTGMLLDVS